MKKVGLVLALMLSVSAQAAFVDITNVGDPDTFLVEGHKVGSTAAEQAWVNDQLGVTGITWEVKVADVDYFATDLDDIFAFELLLEPEFFLVKNATRIALFENVESLDWGVFDMTALSNAFHFGDDFTISHVTEFDASECVGCGPGTHNVPEPTTLALLGIAILGFAGYRTKYG